MELIYFIIIYTYYNYIFRQNRNEILKNIILNLFLKVNVLNLLIS